MSLKKTGIGWLVLFMGLTGFSQEEGGLFEGYERMTFDGPETIYIDYENEVNNCAKEEYKQWSKKWQSDEGLVFNTCKKSFLFPKGGKADTLSRRDLPKHFFTTLNGVEDKYQTFRWLIRKKLPPEDTDKLYQAYGRNDVFKTYLIVDISENKVICYPVIWRFDDNGL